MLFSLRYSYILMQEKVGAYGLKINVKKTKMMKISTRFTIFNFWTLTILGALLHSKDPVRKKLDRE